MSITAAILTLYGAYKSPQEIQDVINVSCPNEKGFTFFKILFLSIIKNIFWFSYFNDKSNVNVTLPPTKRKFYSKSNLNHMFFSRYPVKIFYIFDNIFFKFISILLIDLKKQKKRCILKKFW